MMKDKFGDIVVPSHQSDWGLRSFVVASPSSWNTLPVGLRSSSFGLDTLAKHLKTHLFGLAYRAHTFEFVLHFVRCDTVTVSPNQIIIIIIILLLLLLLLLLLFKLLAKC